MKEPESKISWRRWLLLPLFLGLTLIVLTRFANAQQLVMTLAQADGLWLAVGILVHAGFFVMDAQLYCLGFSIVGVKSRLWQILPILFAGYLVNSLMPSGGAAAAALFIDDAARRGESGARATVGTVLVLLLDLSTLIPFIVFGTLYLHTREKLALYDIISGILFVLYIVVLTTAIALAKWKLAWLRRVLQRVRRTINRVGQWFKRDELIGEGWPAETADELAVAAGAIAAHPRRLTLALLWRVLMHTVNLSGLYAFFVAFEQPVPLGTLVAGFAMGIVFFVVSVIPNGIAVVEGIMALVFTSLDVPADKAGAVIFAFRGVNFWLPLIVGFISLRWVRTFRGSSSVQASPEGAASDPDSGADEDGGNGRAESC